MRSQLENKKKLVILVDKSILTIIKIYGAETDQTINEVIKEPLKNFQNSLLNLATQINDVRTKAQLEQFKKEQEKKIISETPLIVPGHKVDPLSPEIPAF